MPAGTMRMYERIKIQSDLLRPPNEDEQRRLHRQGRFTQEVMEGVDVRTELAWDGRPLPIGLHATCWLQVKSTAFWKLLKATGGTLDLHGAAEGTIHRKQSLSGFQFVKC